jgi:hypothetical protein
VQELVAGFAVRPRFVVFSGTIQTRCLKVTVPLLIGLRFDSANQNLTTQFTSQALGRKVLIYERRL